MVLVLDASVAIGWVAETQATPLSELALVAVNRESGLVPAHFGIEIARALRNRERRNLMTADAVDSSLSQIRALQLRHDSANPLDVVERAVVLARRHRLRVADAAYLELALRTGLPLATQDSALSRASIAAGVKLFGAD